MKKYGRVGLALWVCFIMFLSQAWGEELNIARIGFENWNRFPEWSVVTREGKAAFGIDESVAREGSGSLLLENQGAEDRIWAVSKLPRLHKPFAAGGRVYVRFWYKTDDLQGKPVLRVEGVNKKQDRVLEAYSYPISSQGSQWQQAEYSFKVKDQKAAFFWLNFTLDQGKGKIWLDNLEVAFEPPIDLKNSPTKVFLEFEDGESEAFPAGWAEIVIRDGGKAIIAGKCAYDGDQSLLLAGEDSNSRALIGLNPIPGFAPEVGVRYKLKVWCKSENLTGSNFIKLEFYDAGLKKLTTMFSVAPKVGTHDWYLLEGLTDVISAETAQCWLNIGVYPGSGKLWLDNFSLEAVKEK